jgi:hypothetical protein
MPATPPPCTLTPEDLAKHDRAWEKQFIVPIAREMKKRGVAYLVIAIRDDGKATYTLEPKA